MIGKLGRRCAFVAAFALCMPLSACTGTRHVAGRSRSDAAVTGVVAGTARPDGSAGGAATREATASAGAVPSAGVISGTASIEPTVSAGPSSTVVTADCPKQTAIVAVGGGTGDNVMTVSWPGGSRRLSGHDVRLALPGTPGRYRIVDVDSGGRPRAAFVQKVSDPACRPVHSS